MNCFVYASNVRKILQNMMILVAIQNDEIVLKAEFINF